MLYLKSQYKELMVRFLLKIVLGALAILNIGLSNLYAQTIGSDGLGNFWLIDSDRVKKIDEDGKLHSSYSNLLLGAPNSIDLSDPFRIFVFFHGSQTLVLLNNGAAIIGSPVDIQGLGLGEVSLACRSTRGGAWLFHRESAELVRTDNQFTRIEQRISIPQKILNQQPNFLTESGGVIFLGLANKFIARFDVYGAMLPQFQIEYMNEFVVEGIHLWVKNKSMVKKVSTYNPKEVVEQFRCECPYTPLIIRGRPACFDGVKFNFCQKNGK